VVAVLLTALGDGGEPLVGGIGVAEHFMPLLAAFAPK